MERRPERVGPYELAGELGRGAMGAVFQAVDSRSGAEVALKLLAVTDERARRRLLAEAKALSRLRHRNVVSLLEAGEERGRPWLALELVRGGSLEARLARDGPLPARDAALLVRSLATGLAHAHREGVLHRDLKPANVLLPQGEGEPKLTDFGLAGLTEADPDQSRLTKSGMFLGTPGYWAPEQAAGERSELGPATDVYGLGAVLYAALTGRPPVQAGSLPELLLATAERRPPPPGADPALDRLVLRCLEKRPGDRPPSIEAVARDLSRWLASGSAAPVPSRRAAAGALLVLLGGVAAGVAWWRSSSPPAPPPEAASTAEVPSAAPAPAIVEETDGVGSPALDALLDEARGHAMRREFGAAIAVFDRALALEPRSARVYVGRGACRAGQGDHALALLDYERALALQPRAARALARRAYSRDAVGDRQGALADYDRAIEELGLREAAVLGNRGMTRADGGDHEGALRDLDEAIQLEPLWASLLAARARSHAARGDREAADRDHERALELEPRNVEALTNRGAARTRRGDHAGAISDFDAALEADPACLLARVNRGVSRAALGAHADAISDFDLALAAEPRDLPALLGRAGSRRALHRLEDALADYERALELDPGSLAALAGRGGTRSNLGQHEAARGDLDQVLARSPDDLRARIDRGGVLLVLREYEAAIADLDLALRARPDSPILLMNRGLARSGLGDHAGAVADYEEALQNAALGSNEAARISARLEAERAKLR